MASWEEYSLSHLSVSLNLRVKGCSTSQLLQAGFSEDSSLNNSPQISFRNHLLVIKVGSSDRQHLSSSSLRWLEASLAKHLQLKGTSLVSPRRQPQRWEGSSLLLSSLSRFKEVSLDRHNSRSSNLASSNQGSSKRNLSDRIQCSRKLRPQI